jgi:hypothetical protein
VIPDHVLAAAIRADLERRVREISRADAGTFGRLSAREWALAVFGFVILPLVSWWWFG